jgi:GAF domain-containing protein
VLDIDIGFLTDVSDRTRDRLNSDLAMVSYVTREHHYALACSGFTLPDDFHGVIPWDFSICVHVQGMNFPLRVDDALQHPLLTGNKSVTEFGIQAYIGAPLLSPKHGAIGSLCALDRHARRWGDSDLSELQSLADEINAVLKARY